MLQNKMDIIALSCVYKERFTKVGNFWVGDLAYGSPSYEKVSKAIKNRFPTIHVEKTPWSSNTAIELLIKFENPADEAEFIVCQEALSIDLKDMICLLQNF